MSIHFRTLSSDVTRAQESETRLLDAAEALLRAGGIDAATVPAIAREAGMSVGNVYKRFPDKDALLRAVFTRFHARATANNARALDPDRWRGAPLGPTLRGLFVATVRSYAGNRRFFAALAHYADTHPDAAIRARMGRLRTAALHDAAHLLLEYRDRIGHPDPEYAVALVLESVAHTLRGIVLAPRPVRRYVADPERVGAELARLVLSYLEMRDEPCEHLGT